MSFCLLIHSWGGANDTVARHWPYYEMAGASRIVGVSTEVGDCRWPEGTETITCGDGAYMNGPNLPTRLMHTIEWSLEQPEQWFACIEYDTLILAPDTFDCLQHNGTNCAKVICHHTGGQTFDSKASFFSHNPWCWNRAAAKLLVPEMKKIIAEGHCGYGKAESSPDVFWAYACERSGVKICFDAWTQFTRNSFDTEGSLQEACDAAAMGVQVIHGCKQALELEAIQQSLYENAGKS